MKGAWDFLCASFSNIDLRKLAACLKIILPRLLKNAQMQVELWEIPLAGAPEILRRERF
jgi:hypothetical protein